TDGHGFSPKSCVGISTGCTGGRKACPASRWPCSPGPARRALVLLMLSTCPAIKPALRYHPFRALQNEPQLVQIRRPGAQLHAAPETADGGTSTDYHVRYRAGSRRHLGQRKLGRPHQGRPLEIQYEQNASDAPAAAGARLSDAAAGPRHTRHLAPVQPIGEG